MKSPPPGKPIWFLCGLVTSWFVLLAGPGSTNEAASQQPGLRPADLVLKNGKVVTLDDARPVVEAVAVTGDTITAIGPNREIERHVGSSTKVIDLKGALAIPGLIDAHAHFTGVGQAAMNLKLGTAKEWDDIVRMVAEAAKTAKPGEWII